MKHITAWLRRWFTPRPAVSVTSLPTLARIDAYVQPATDDPLGPEAVDNGPSVAPITDAERQAAGDAARAARAIEIAALVRVNPLADSPEVCAARAADPAWQGEQAAKREAASAEYVRYRNEDSGLPMVVKGRY